MRICIVTDAWRPQINGVVRVIEAVRRALERAGHTVAVIEPGAFRSIPMPTYPEIRLAVRPRRKVARLLDAFRPDAVHIATEGPLGLSARAQCLRRGWPFTTAYHTRFPEYMHTRFRTPLSWMYAWMRHVHRPSARVLVPAASTLAELRRRGFRHLSVWPHGVDTDTFRPRDRTLAPFAHLPRPIFLFLGRIAVEKNLPAFLDLDLPGSKVVAGVGPALEGLRRRYPDVFFTSPPDDATIAACYAAADALVFPSRTDTFGLVLLEALACGLPVAAFPVAGPRDVLAGVDPAHPVGVLDEDLRRAALKALDLDRERCRAFALRHSWDAVAATFLDRLASIPVTARAPVTAVAVAPDPDLAFDLHLDFDLDFDLDFEPERLRHAGESSGRGA
ncbi:glycosyltransferase family 1 protein [Roseospira marina]|uniref:Glycosyltransferase family 1 protein n=1 Tax=Roseospira marina TaxID=140057 RepID=A0A5M6IGT3_9PROT|nr:glycosyltransferase family 1 protein [Roseospira marina]KAA5607434.1 glycosyltransferase family 1 protein [Roseospira marina]MBB4312389.1 glycosyltransferase involved in cell wall biosynthesis [Roseospira marina]MBB5085595.1 glycosyltransferase involved in cell wall biosynthesis [Roseospira marina]